MAWSYVASTAAANVQDGAGASTIVVTLGAAVSVDDDIVGMAGWGGNANNISQVTDSLGNSYTLDADKTDDVTNDQSGRTWRSHVTVGGTPTITVTFTASVSFRRVITAAWRGGASSPFDQSQGNQQAAPGTGTDACTSGAITTAEADELCVGLYQDTGGAGTISYGTNYTGRLTSGTILAIEDRVLVSAGSVAATFTHGAPDAATIVHIVALKVASAPPSEPAVETLRTVRSGLRW